MLILELLSAYRQAGANASKKFTHPGLPATPLKRGIKKLFLFGNWNLGFVWKLKIGIWDFT
jgi:hypothetical protein